MTHLQYFVLVSEGGRLILLKQPFLISGNKMHAPTCAICNTEKYGWRSGEIFLSQKFVKILNVANAYIWDIISYGLVKHWVQKMWLLVAKKHIDFVLDMVAEHWYRWWWWRARKSLRLILSGVTCPPHSSQLSHSLTVSSHLDLPTCFNHNEARLKNHSTNS